MKCKPSTLLSVYRNEVANGGSWGTVAEKTGLEESTAKQNIGAIRKTNVQILVAGGKTEDEAKTLVAKVIPRFPRASGVRQTPEHKLELEKMLLELSEEAANGSEDSQETEDSVDVPVDEQLVEA